MNQIMPLLNLYSEIIAGFVVASVLSLLIGWLMHRSRARRQLDAMNASWEQRYRAIEEISRVDTENLEEQLQNLATETRDLQIDKKLLNESLRRSESTIQNFRAETIELNRQHAETQERLQRIIQQKDRELLELGNRLNELRSVVDSQTTAGGSSPRGENVDSGELTCADTVAINSREMLDATVQIPADELPSRRSPTSSFWNPSGDDSLDDSVDTELQSAGNDTLEVEEATMAMDEDALALAREASNRRRNE